MRAAEDTARRQLINVQHNTELRKIRQAHARTRRLEQELNLPHAFDASRGVVWGVVSGKKGRGGGASSAATLQASASRGDLGSQRVMDLRDEHDYGNDTIFVPHMTNMTLKPPSRQEHNRLAASLATSFSAPIIPAAMLPSSSDVVGRVRTPSHAPPDPRVATPGWELDFTAVQRLTTPKVPKHRQLPTAHSDVSWSASRVENGDLRLTMGRSRRGRGPTPGAQQKQQQQSLALPVNTAPQRETHAQHGGTAADDWGAPGERAAMS